MDKFLDILAKVIVYTFLAAVGAAYIYVAFFKVRNEPAILIIPYIFALVWASARLWR